MRFLFSPIVFLALTAFSAKGQADVEATLKNIIESETEAFTRMSFADVAKTFWLLDDLTLFNATADGMCMQIRKEDFLQNTNVPPAGHATVVKSNYRYIVNGDLASATYDQVVSIVETGDKFHSREMHIFKKVDGVWKIYQSSVHRFTP